MIELNEKQKHLAMMQASPSYRKSPEAFYLEMRALESVPEEPTPSGMAMAMQMGPTIREAIIEECARVCESAAQGGPSTWTIRAQCANAIRALKSASMNVSRPSEG